MPVASDGDFVWTNVQKSVVLMGFDAIRAGRTHHRETERDGSDEVPPDRGIRR
jgi:hypothetical protein